ncbi:MAG TPA: hypothetical protein PLL20_22175 [Phycisphaerae bacterium]|nr:hypothetical protein [Phycisphaerae bacterium]HRS12981.1 hypothetical protein [Sedimentisphaerales bacterium]
MKAHSERKRDLFIEGRLLGMDIQQASEHAGISSRCGYAWMKQEDFRKRLEQARQAMFEGNIASLSTLTADVIQRLRQIVNDDASPAAHWIKVAELVLREGRASEAAAIRERMDEIERLLRVKDGGE